MGNINALLLAAGYGTRLRPFTLTTPKCLASVGGKPIIENWIEALEETSCNIARINTHYLADKVVEHIDQLNNRNMKIELVHEPELLGTAGTLLANRDLFSNSSGLLIHADNAMKGSLNEFIDAHNKRPDDCALTMLTFKTREPQKCGIVELDSQGRMIAFHEKKQDPPGNIANGAVYAFDASFIREIEKLEKEEGPLKDFSCDVLPRMVGRVATWMTDDIYIDIGSQESLLEAQRLWGQGK